MQRISYVLILNLFIGLGFSQISFAQTNKKQAAPKSTEQAAPKSTEQVAPKLNTLELALDFQTGTKAQYMDWYDDGHLNNQARWNGINLIAVEAQRGSDGLLDFVALVPEQTSSIKEIRTALNIACGIKDDDWDREQLQGRTTLKAQGTKCRANFNNWFRGNGIWGISIYKNKQTAN